MDVPRLVAECIIENLPKAENMVHLSVLKNIPDLELVHYVAIYPICWHEHRMECNQCLRAWVRFPIRKRLLLTLRQVCSTFAMVLNPQELLKRGFGYSRRKYGDLLRIHTRFDMRWCVFPLPEDSDLYDDWKEHKEQECVLFCRWVCKYCQRAGNIQELTYKDFGQGYLSNNLTNRLKERAFSAGSLEAY